MKVLALITDGFGATGGIAQYNRDLLTALAQSRRVASVVALPRYGDHLASRPERLEQVPARAGKSRWIADALRLATAQRFDTVLCGHLHAVPAAAAVAKAAGAQLWLQLHGIEAWLPHGSLVRFGVKRASLVTAVSRFTRRAFLQWAPIAAERVRVLPNTVSANYAPRARRPDLIERYGLAGKRVILTVGRLAADERYKGHDRVIAAMPAVLAEGPAVYLIVGSGGDRERLESLARMNGVAAHVVFAGQVAAAELPDHFAIADVYAMPSTGEGFGIVFIEAAASCLPVIGGNRDGSSDALADGRIGTMIDPCDRHALEAALIAAVRRPRREEGSPSAEEGVARFRFSNFATQVDALVGDLVAH